MFLRESKKTWYAVYLVGFSAFLLMFCIIVPNAPFHRIASSCALLFAAGSIWFSMPKMPMNRTLGAIHDDIRSGKQAPSTPLQKLCTVLGIALMAVIFIHSAG